MKYFIKRIMEGNFPGSPNYDYVMLTDKEMETIWEMFRYRWRDTKEQAEVEI